MLSTNAIKIIGIVGGIGTAIGGAATFISSMDSAADKIKELKETQKTEETEEEES